MIGCRCHGIARSCRWYFSISSLLGSRGSGNDAIGRSSASVCSPRLLVVVLPQEVPRVHSRHLWSRQRTLVPTHVLLHSSLQWVWTSVHLHFSSFLMPPDTTSCRERRASAHTHDGSLDFAHLERDPDLRQSRSFIGTKCVCVHLPISDEKSSVRWRSTQNLVGSTRVICTIVHKYVRNIPVLGVQHGSLCLIAAKMWGRDDSMCRCPG